MRTALKLQAQCHVATRARIEALVASLPAPHAAPLRGLDQPIRSWDQAMADMLQARINAQSC